MSRNPPAGATIPAMSLALELAAVQRRLGYTFQDEELLRTALTHRSWANEQGVEGHYERAEFLGDAVLDLLVAHWLFEQHPDMDEGRLSKIKSHLVSEPVLATWAESLELGGELLLGVGEERSGGRDKRSLLADATEAVLGAAYLDGGLEAARRIANRWLAGAAPAAFEEVATMDAKTALQEHAQALGLDLPTYVLVDEEGPDHEKVFHVECWLLDRIIGQGVGASKKQAEQAAARAALDSLGRQPEIGREID